MSEPDFDAMDDILGPPPTPIKKGKKGLFSRFFTKEDTESKAAESGEDASAEEPMPDQPAPTGVADDTLQEGADSGLLSERRKPGKAKKAKPLRLPRDPKKLQQLVTDLQERYIVLRSEVEDREKTLRHVESLLKEKQRDYADREKTLNSKEKLLRELTTDIAEKKAKLSEKDAKLKETEEYLDKFEESLKRQEKDVHTLREDAEKEIAQLTKEKQHLSDSIIELSAKRQTLAALVDEEQNRLKEIREVIRKQLDENTVRNKKLAKEEQKLLTFKSELDRLAIALQSREESLTAQEKELVAREKTLADSQSSFDKEIKGWRGQLASLDAKKRGLDQEILDKENYVKDLAQNEKLLSDKETTIINRIKELEADQKLLEEREREIVETVSILENDRKLLDEKEQEFVNVIDNLEKKESTLLKRELVIQAKEKDITRREQDIKAVEDDIIKTRDALEEKEKKISRVKELKANTDQLEKQIVQLQQDISTLGSKKLKLMEIKELDAQIQELKIQRERLRTELEKERDALEVEINKLSAKAADLNEYKRLERQLSVREEFLTRKEEELDNAWQTVHREDTQLVERAVREAPSHVEDLRTEAELRSEIAQAETPRQLEIYSIIAKTRDALKRGDLVAARQWYQQLKPLYTRLQVSNSERKKIYYEVLELKTDIELSALT